MSTHARPRSLRVVALVSILSLLGVFFAVATASQASALCVTPAEDGVWRNYDVNTRSITTAEVHLANCGDVCSNGVCPPTTYSVRLWGSCSPTDCDWGTRTGQRTADGWIRVTYHFGFKTSYVWTKTYVSGSTTWLRVWIWNDYHDDRTDRATDDWFLKA